MNEQEEQVYLRGRRRAWTEVISLALRELGHDEATSGAAALREREYAVSALRELCEEFGDNDWPDRLWLPDVIEKHLGRRLRILREQRDSAAGVVRCRDCKHWTDQRGPRDDTFRCGRVPDTCGPGTVEPKPRAYTNSIEGADFFTAGDFSCALAEPKLLVLGMKADPAAPPPIVVSSVEEARAYGIAARPEDFVPVDVFVVPEGDRR